MISRRRLTLTSVAVALSVLGGVIAWGLVRSAGPDTGVRLVNGRLIGEATGYVAGVDADERLLQVSSSLLRLRPLKLSVGDDATIRIRDKEGGLGDLALDMPVHVTYEVDGATRRVRSVELLSTPSGALPSSRVPRVSESPRTSEVPRATEPPRVSEPAGVRDPFRVPEPPRTLDATRSTEAPRKNITVPARPSVDEKSSGAAGASSASRPSVQRTPDDGAPDGSAAIDWLLKNRGSAGR